MHEALLVIGFFVARASVVEAEGKGFFMAVTACPVATRDGHIPLFSQLGPQVLDGRPAFHTPPPPAGAQSEEETGQGSLWCCFGWSAHRRRQEAKPPQPAEL